MAKYTVKDKLTGRTVVLEGDHPPTPEDLESLLGPAPKPAAAPQPSAPEPVAPESGSGLGATAREIGTQVVGTSLGQAVDLPMRRADAIVLLAPAALIYMLLPMRKASAIILLALATLLYVLAIWVIEKNVNFSLVYFLYTIKDVALLGNFIVIALGALVFPLILFYVGYRLLPSSGETNKAKKALGAISAIGIVAALVIPMLVNRLKRVESLRSAEQGDASAHYNLGVMYANGDGVLMGSAEAAKWYRKSAEQGNATAQSNLGAMYASGNGVIKDIVQAHAWYNNASANGDERVRELMGFIEKQMTPEQKAEATKLAREIFERIEAKRK